MSSLVESKSPRLYLASQSPRRAQLLQQIFVEFERLNINVDEAHLADELPLDYVDRLARAKAAAGWQRLVDKQLPKLPVLGADTAVVLDGVIMGKPENQQQGVAMLTALSGRSHQVMSGVCVYYGVKEDKPLLYSEVSITDVTFRTLSEGEIIDYWRSGEPCDKAGGYGIQGRAAVFVERLEGSYSSVVGLPLFETTQLLTRIELALQQ